MMVVVVNQWRKRHADEEKGEAKIPLRRIRTG